MSLKVSSHAALGVLEGAGNFFLIFVEKSLDSTSRKSYILYNLGWIVFYGPILRENQDSGFPRFWNFHHINHLLTRAIF
jgi:hypothetical protein